MALMLGCAALALSTYRVALGGYFTPDDLIYLERTRGIVPQQPILLWRFLSGPAYFQAMVALFGAHPFPYMLMNWLVHGANVALLYLWVRRWGGSAAAATLAAGLFGTSRLFLTTLQQAVTIGELGSLTLTLGAFLVALERGTRARVGSLVLFVAALLFKENVLLLPLVLLQPPADGEPWRPRLARTIPLLIPGLLLVAFLAVRGAQNTTFGGEAYSMAFGANLFHDLMTYSAWVVDLKTLVPDLPGVYSTTAWSVGLWVTLGLLALAIATWRSSRAAAAGALLWLLALAPVLPLTHHTFLHYLYAPFAGLTMALGAALDLLRHPMRSRASRAITWAVVSAVVIGHAVFSNAMIHERLETKLPGRDLPLDTFARKSEMAHRVVSGFGRYVTGRPQRALVFAPAEGSRAYDVRTGEPVEGDSISPRYFLLPTVVDQGRALRAIFPSIDSVVFTSHWTPDYRDFDLIVTGPDGGIENLGQGLPAQQDLVTRLLTAGMDRTARQHLETVVAEWPDNAFLRLAYSVALGRTGDEPAGMKQLEEIVRRTPHDSLAVVARKLIEQAATVPSSAAQR